MSDHTKFVTGFMFLLTLFISPLQPCTAMEGPDMVEIDILAQLYEPVEFDHLMHADVVEGDCAACHHHTTGTPVVDENCIKCHANSGEADEVACQECHAVKRFDADYLKKLDDDTTLYHVDRMGLKGAYHTKCMNCHEEMGGPTGCQDCHARTEIGDKVFHAGAYAPPETDQPVHGGGH